MKTISSPETLITTGKAVQQHNTQSDNTNLKSESIDLYWWSLNPEDGGDNSSETVS
jgi:hypothetical protein